MLAAFWSGLGGELAKQWIARVLTPTFAFWAGGFAAVWWHEHGEAVDEHGWTSELGRWAKPLEQLPFIAQALLVIGALMLVAVSSLAAERLTLPLLRLLEGYWPACLRSRTVSRRRRRLAKKSGDMDRLRLVERQRGLTIAEYLEFLRLDASPSEDPERLHKLRQRRAHGLSPRVAAEIARTRMLLRFTPADDAFAMPTRLGDVLRAAERRPYEKYGLDSIVCWTALWLVLPTEARTELVQARARLDGALRMWLWGVAFIVWTPWTLWAIPIAVVVPLVAYYGGMVGAAKLFGDLTGSAYDLYRMQLYDSLHLPRPASPADERRHGKAVNDLLWGGLDDPSLKYVASPSS